MSRWTWTLAYLKGSDASSEPAQEQGWRTALSLCALIVLVLSSQIQRYNAFVSTLKWLHLSDWHQGRPKSQPETDRSVVRDALITDLKRRRKLNEELADLDFIFFTGDLAYSGKKTEYKAAAEDFLDRILEATQVGKDRLLMVPGNHDLDRDYLQALPPLLKTFTDRSVVDEWLGDDIKRRNLLAPMTEYEKFWLSYLGTTEQSGPLLSHARTYDVRGKSIVVIGLNSAWMCGQNKTEVEKNRQEVNDYGFLILGERQFHQWIPDAQTAPVADVRICLLHHPFWWMSPIEGRNKTERRLVRTCHFILQGHEHDAEVKVPNSTSGDCAIISAGAAYDRRDNAESPNGYNLVHIDFEQRHSTVYLRKYDDKKGEYIADPTATEGRWTFTLPKELGGLPESKEPKKTAELGQVPTEERGFKGAAVAVEAPKIEKHFGEFEGFEQLPESERELVESTDQDKIIGDVWAIQNPTTLKNLGEIYRIHHAGSSFEYVSAVFLVKANSLAARGAPGYGEPDFVQSVKVFKPLHDPIYCYKITLTITSTDQFLGQASWTLTDGQGGKVKTIPVPVRRVGRKGIRELLLFFDPILRPKTGPYTMDFRWLVNESMAPLRDLGKDELFLDPTRAAGLIGRMDLVLKVPVSFGNLQMMQSGRPEASRQGRPMTKGELSSYEESDGTFNSYGWTGTNLEPDTLFAADVVKLNGGRAK